MFQNYNTLGFMNPFYTVSNGVQVYSSEPNKLYNMKNSIHIDAGAVIQMLNFQYFLADRTLIKEVNRTPFMARPNEEATNWIFDKLPEHKEINNKSESEIAATLYKKLENEIIEYCAQANTVGILLSGGMDSRVVAGVLNNLIKNKDLNCKVIGLTWGKENSRDVDYARKIVNNLNWEWQHFDLGPEQLKENIKIAAENGCEYAPNHLHAMPQVAKLSGIDCILAGSFGDSIGRGEYSGKHFSNLKPLDLKIQNKFNLMKNNVFKENKAQTHLDIKTYDQKFPRNYKFQTYELQRQIHYMRRMLNPCMSLINEKTPVYQVFTTPSTFGFMWSLSKESRNDQIYYHLLKYFDDFFQHLPWARTGKPYLHENINERDRLSSTYHEYGKWVRNDLHDYLYERVISSNIENLNLFNMESIEAVMNINKKMATGSKHNRIDEIILWLASLSTFVENHKVTTQRIGSDSKLKEKLNGKIVSKINAGLYNSGRNLLKK